MKHNKGLLYVEPLISHCDLQSIKYFSCVVTIIMSENKQPICAKKAHINSNVIMTNKTSRNGNRESQQCRTGLENEKQNSMPATQRCRRPHQFSVLTEGSHLKHQLTSPKCQHLLPQRKCDFKFSQKLAVSINLRFSKS